MDMRRIIAAAIVVGLWLLPVPSSAQPVPGSPADAARPPAASGERARVDGFRNAKWGMTEAQVKTVIANDFKIPADKLKSEPNVNEKTTVLSISVPDLVDGAGIARVSYIFGYTTKKLIQVNIAWGTPVDPQAKPELVVAAANQLRQLFLDAGYEPGSIISNARASDGAVVVFGGEDADKHTTLLRLVSAQAPADKEAKESGDAKSAAVTALYLSYIMDGRNPDIFKLKKGQF